MKMSIHSHGTVVWPDTGIFRSSDWRIASQQKFRNAKNIAGLSLSCPCGVCCIHMDFCNPSTSNSCFCGSSCPFRAVQHIPWSAPESPYSAWSPSSINTLCPVKAHADIGSKEICLESRLSVSREHFDYKSSNSCVRRHRFSPQLTPPGHISIGNPEQKAEHHKRGLCSYRPRLRKKQTSTSLNALHWFTE